LNHATEFSGLAHPQTRASKKAVTVSTRRTHVGYLQIQLSSSLRQISGGPRFSHTSTIPSSVAKRRKATLLTSPWLVTLPAMNNGIRTIWAQPYYSGCGCGCLATYARIASASSSLINSAKEIIPFSVLEPSITTLFHAAASTAIGE
jgi:hypothetical protein